MEGEHTRLDKISGVFGAVHDACIRPTRLVSFADGTAVVANGVELIALQLAEGDAAASEGVLNPRTNVRRTSSMAVARREVHATGHRHAIQTIAKASSGVEDFSRIATIDAAGVVAMNKLGGRGSEHPMDVQTSITHPVPCGGWAGVTFMQRGQALAATHQLSRNIWWLDPATMQETARLHCLQAPTSIFTDVSCDAQLTGITEGNALSVWDSRAGSPAQACIARQLVSKEQLWTGMIRGNNVLVAGADRNLFIYDTRTWRLSHRWRCPSKYDIVHLMPSAQSEHSIYVAGTDHELLLCNYMSSTATVEPSGDGPRHAPLPATSKLHQVHHRGVRADGRWVGLDVLEATDGRRESILALCDNAHMYAVLQSDAMTVAT